MIFDFPKDFLFGAASSACQIESAYFEDGKGEDVMGYYGKIYPEKFAGSHPNDSADFYHKYHSFQCYILMISFIDKNVFSKSYAKRRLFAQNSVLVLTI